MAITQSDTTRTDTIESSTTVDLGVFVDDIPSGATAEIIVRGDRSSYELEFIRRGTRWIVEGESSSAILSAVYDSTGPVGLPETVPGWIRAFCLELNIREVSVRR
ncbi:hypothetical protein [Natronorubrum daqingense]|nr:hypothetical protein [Natronorubrum daqingense]APX98585.1 hypothetical protein BB347_17960 [Natronorubrum daqingense]